MALLQPDREDHIEAAAVRNACRRSGVQISTIDAVLIQLCLRHDLVCVRVNAVCPGWIKTKMDVGDQGSGADSDADIENCVPMARFARPGDVAAAIVWLADPDKSAFVNGVALAVDGGWSADVGREALPLATCTP